MPATQRNVNSGNQRSEEMQGLYAVQFGTPLGSGEGVIIGNAGELIGGDLGYMYTGTYSQTGDAVTVLLRARRHTANNDPSVFGTFNDFALHLEGTNSSGRFSGTSPDVPGVTISVVLTKAPQSGSIGAWQAFARRFLSM